MEDELSPTEEKYLDVDEEQKEFLYNRIEELKSFNAALLAENDMFERFISRLDPQDLVSQAAAEDPGAAGASQPEVGSRGRRRKSRVSVDRTQQLTLKQKLYLAQNEVAETQQDQKKLRQKYEEIQDHYMASLEEADLRLGEIKKATNDLERRLLKPLKDNRLEINDPEKLLLFIKDKSKINQLERYTLKNQALKAHEKKLQQQLQKRREMGKAEYEEALQEFNEPIIDNDLDELQIVNLKVQRVLSSHKEILQKVTWELSELGNDIAKKKQMLAKTEEAIQNTEEERLKAQLFNEHLRRQMDDYQAPGITDYMYVKDKYKTLKHSVHTWERKVGIAEMALKTHTKAWNKQRSAHTPMNSAETAARSGGRQIPVKLPHIAEDKERERERVQENSTKLSEENI